MVEEIQDKLAERIAKRRAENEAKRKAETSAVNPLATLADPVEPEKPRADTTQPLRFSSETKPAPKTTEPTQDISQAMTAIDSGANPLEIARLLSAIVGAGMSRKELIAKIQKSEGWLSKKINLLKAPKEFKRLIEAGELSESEYYDNRQNVKSGIYGRGPSAHYKRMPTVEIDIDAAKSLVRILQTIAKKEGAQPITLNDKASKKDIMSILNLRAGEILGLLE